MFERIKEKKEISLCKNPEKYDEYVCNLSDKYRKIAESELKETDEVRENAIKAMREWIATNPNIISCRTDAVFLLRFLRVCKFSVPSACTKLEKFIRTHQTYDTLYNNVSIHDPQIRKLFEYQWLIPLPQKDKLGRQIIFFQSGHLEPNQFTSADILRAMELVYQIFYDDEEAQIAGMEGIFEDSGFKMGHITMWSFTEMKDAVKYYQTGMPTRFKGFRRVGLPSFGQAVYDLFKSLLNKKIRNRLSVSTFYYLVKDIK